MVLFAAAAGVSLATAWHVALSPPSALSESTEAAAPAPTLSPMHQGSDAFRRGDFERAAVAWQGAVLSARQAGNRLGESDALVALAQAHLALGFHTRAAQSLELASTLAQSAGDKSRQAAALDLLSQAYLAAGRPDPASETLQDAQRLATEAGDRVRLAMILHTMGAVRAALKQDAEALASYQEARRLADASRQPMLAATATINAGKMALVLGRAQDAQALFDDALVRVKRLPNSHDKAFALTSIGLGYAGLRPRGPAAGDRLLVLAADVLEEAGEVAKGLGDARAASYALGHRGRLYEQERRYDEALLLTRLAVGYGQQVHQPESLYRWEWQTGRILKAQGHLDEAIPPYQRAADLVQTLRPEMVTGASDISASFRESGGRLFFELADLLLQRSSRTSSREEAQPYLTKAREAVELFKTAELRDYFRDECVDAFQGRVTKVEDVSRQAAVIYPIILPDRTEMLVSLPDGMHRLTIPVKQEELTEEVRAFRRLLQKETTREYLRHAQRLYDRLLRPLEPILAQFRLDTLVIVPDGPLRMIPLAALHDGKQFLIARYAIATTPGLNLTDPKPLARDRIQVLSAGLSEAVQGFPPLPNTPGELEAIGSLYKGHRLLNQQFRVSTLEQELKDQGFTIVHIASHGKFERDVKDSFLLTFDGKLTMDRLNQVVGSFRFRDQPLELLTLSACQTAAGDDRAALGLAGVAIKAGARSALATLWFVSDEASSSLVVEFYRQLRDPSVSKAMALRKA
ncbi:MAG: CHAT domain-containing protein, partial [Egibacteraceae bacterium]